jgi:hypothetical protein
VTAGCHPGSAAASRQVDSEDVVAGDVAGQMTVGSLIYCYLAARPHYYQIPQTLKRLPRIRPPPLMAHCPASLRLSPPKNVNMQIW